MLISVDPGETCGYAIWDGGVLFEADEKPQEEFLDYLSDTIGLYSTILFEEYRLRESSARAMIGDEFVTSQVIGVIKWLGRKNGVELVKQTPAQKEFFTNEKLKQLNVYNVGKIHSRDAIRHGLYHLMFTTKERSLGELTSSPRK